ncbi:hypothetical protein KC644_00025 [Candidatus Berkelbacteria bacterium]|nr:hypothetical protein [Candidatus Berkelbacteria bacterium]
MDELQKFNPSQISDGQVKIPAVDCAQCEQFYKKILGGNKLNSDEATELVNHLLTCQDCMDKIDPVLEKLENNKPH